VDANRPFSGFAEVPHTADIALDVFAPNLEELFINAAKGLYHILGIRKGTKEVENIHVSMVAEDREGLMVSLLNELLFHAANNQAGEFISLEINENQLEADLHMLEKTGQQKEVKAATFNDLVIVQDAEGFHTRIVFDV
jgi:SHS2 domain-containing protein